MNVQETYRRWVCENQDTELSVELAAIADDPDAIADRFYKDLEFGTGGLRGVLGAGTNRMNVHTVAKATQGYAKYLRNKTFKRKGNWRPTVAIAYDSRLHSKKFAEIACRVLLANGAIVYVYCKPMPTPALSFAVRKYHCDGGIVITASHNPARYNGYKVYGPDGCQITPEVAEKIQTQIEKVDPFKVGNGKLGVSVAKGKLCRLDKNTDKMYLEVVGKCSLLPPEISRDVAIVYTPLNGAGISCVPKCLKEHGFTNLTIPKEQKDPDGRFPTCPYPNPEVREALEVGLAWAAKTNSDLLLATDPDCDRVGTAVRTENGYTLISGNEMGVLLLDFVCKMRIANGTMPAKPVAVKTIVTTPMAEKVAAKYGVKLINVLTGFKYIGEQISRLEEKGEEDRFIFGFEESYGYLSITDVRDKDAVNASLLICEMFAWYKAQGKTLVDVLNELYQEHGFVRSRLLSYSFQGASGFEKMQCMMEGLRKNPPTAITDIAVEQVVDYLDKDATGLPTSNVLRFLLRDGSEVTVRPSGTEPKLKVYLTASDQDKGEALVKTDRLAQYFDIWAAN